MVGTLPFTALIIHFTPIIRVHTTTVIILPLIRMAIMATHTTMGIIHIIITQIIIIVQFIQHARMGTRITDALPTIQMMEEDVHRFIVQQIQDNVQHDLYRQIQTLIALRIPATQVRMIQEDVLIMDHHKQIIRTTQTEAHVLQQIHQPKEL